MELEEENSLPLPVEIFLMVFDSLDDASLIRVGLSCRSFRELTYKPSLYLSRMTHFFLPDTLKAEEIRELYFKTKVFKNRLRNPAVFPIEFDSKISTGPILSFQKTEEGWAVHTEVEHHSEISLFKSDPSFVNKQITFTDFNYPIFISKGKIFYAENDKMQVVSQENVHENETLFKNKYPIVSFLVSQDKIFVNEMSDIIVWDIKAEKIQRFPWEIGSEFACFEDRVFYCSAASIGIIEEEPKKLLDISNYELENQSLLYVVKGTKIIIWDSTIRIFDWSLNKEEERENKFFDETKDGSIPPQVFENLILIVTKDKKSLKIFDLTDFNCVRTLITEQEIECFAINESKIYLGLGEGTIVTQDFDRLIRNI